MPVSEIVETAFQHIRATGALRDYFRELMSKTDCDATVVSETPEGIY